MKVFLLNISQIKILYFIKKKIFSFIIIFIFLILLSNILPEIFFSDKREFQLLEIIQNIILIYIFVLNFQFRKLFLKVSNLFTFLIRQSFILFILYEELSFLTYSSKNLINYQREFNLHNSHLLHLELFSFTIPNTNLIYTLSLDRCLFLSILFILGYGSYFSCFKKIRYFFLEKQYAIYTFLYAINLGFSIFSKLHNNSNVYPIRGEVLELFFYFLIFTDTLKKRKIMTENRLIE